MSAPVRLHQQPIAISLAYSGDGPRAQLVAVIVPAAGKLSRKGPLDDFRKCRVDVYRFADISHRPGAGRHRDDDLLDQVRRLRADDMTAEDLPSGEMSGLTTPSAFIALPRAVSSYRYVRLA